MEVYLAADLSAELNQVVELPLSREQIGLALAEQYVTAGNEPGPVVARSRAADLPSRAPRPDGLCVDAHTHLSVPAAARMAKPYFRPEFEPRSLYSSAETTRYNTEYRASPLNTAQFEDAEQRLADMDAQGIDVQVLSVPPTEYFYWLPDDEAKRANRIQHERFAEVVRRGPIGSRRSQMCRWTILRWPSRPCTRPAGISASAAWRSAPTCSG